RRCSASGGRLSYWPFDGVELVGEGVEPVGERIAFEGEVVGVEPQHAGDLALGVHRVGEQRVVHGLGHFAGHHAATSWSASMSLSASSACCGTTPLPRARTLSRRLMPGTPHTW